MKRQKLKIAQALIFTGVFALLPLNACQAKQPFSWPTAKDDRSSKDHSKDKSKDTSTQSTDDSKPTPTHHDDTGSAATSESTNDSPKKEGYSEEAKKHYNRGVELHQSGFLNQAVTEYKAAIDSDNRMEEAWSNLGLIYAAQRSYVKATESFEKALTLNPGRATTLNGLGTVLYARGRTEEAMAKWRQAIAVDPRFASAYYNMANALENEHKLPEAVDAYKQALEINPSMADAYYRIGAIYGRQKHRAQAKILLSKALTISPEGDFAREAKKQLYAIDGQINKEGDENGAVEVTEDQKPSSQSAAKNHHGIKFGKSRTDKADKQAVVTKGQTESSTPDLKEKSPAPILTDPVTDPQADAKTQMNE